MIKSFVKHGNSWAIVMDRPILDILKIDPTTQQVELTTDGKSLSISPIKEDQRTARVRAAREKINRKHAKAFKKLAE
jgi:antitoxin component of MazEF toxin-antitoxin module